MKILALKTSSAETELFILEDMRIITNKTWESGRGLAKGLALCIRNFLNENNIKEIDGYIGYLGPGSFTGLRIGLSTLNAIAYTCNKPLVGARGDDWVFDGARRLLNEEDDRVLMPEYGSEANITIPKKVA